MPKKSEKNAKKTVKKKRSKYGWYYYYIIIALYDSINERRACIVLIYTTPLPVEKNS